MIVEEVGMAWQVDENGRPERPEVGVRRLYDATMARLRTDDAHLKLDDGDLVEMVRSRMENNSGIAATLAWVLGINPTAPISRREMPDPTDAELAKEDLYIRDVQERLVALPEHLTLTQFEAASNTLAWVRFAQSPSPAWNDLDEVLDVLLAEAI